MKDIRGIYVKENLKNLLEWFEGTNKSLKVFLRLVTYGKDKYSRLSLEELKTYTPEDVQEYFESKKLLGDTKNAMRWYLRGLSKEDALKKAEVDAVVRLSKYANKK